MQNNNYVPIKIYFLKNEETVIQKTMSLHKTGTICTGKTDLYAHEE